MTRSALKTTLKKITAIIPAAALMLATAATTNSCKEKKIENTDMENIYDGPIVVLETTVGALKIKLYNATPKHRDNFLKLCTTKYYDKTCFHRVIDGFMIQGGDPYSRDTAKFRLWGQGGPDYTIPAEFNDSLRHCKGAVAAARIGNEANPRKASSGSQFYIVQSEKGCRHLDGEYTVFGQVIEGLELIDKIAGCDTDVLDRPYNPVYILSTWELKPIEPADSTVAGDSLAGKDSVAASGDNSKKPGDNGKEAGSDNGKKAGSDNAATK